MSLARALPVLLIALVGCKDKPASSGPAPSASGSTAPSGSASIDPDVDEVKPVYPLDVKPSPLAQKLCAALHETPEARKAACCGRTPGFVFMMGECVRNLSAALEGKAITLAAQDVDACAAAIGKQYDGCDWVGPYALAIPDACRNVIKGAIAIGQACRSNLECVGDANCAGVGPTTPGRCTAPRAVGSGCGRAVDVLGTYTKQEFEETHRECAGSCSKFKCVADPPKPQPPKPALKGAGEACEVDRECLAACVKGDAGGKGVCGKRCD